VFFLYKILSFLIEILIFGMLILVILSWIPASSITTSTTARLDTIREFLERIYSPILEFLRGIVKPIELGGKLVDLTPGLFVVLLVVLNKILAWLLLPALVIGH